jgi:outer membrane lipoprotein SlyB
MRVTRIVAILAAAPLAAGSGCYTASSYSRTYGEGSYSEGGYPGSWERRGKVATIRETVDRQVGDPGGGAVAGALIGGALTGRAGGAILGALFGAAASQGSVERRFYEVFVRFDDGGQQVFHFRGAPPFQIGDRVVVTDRGIFRG